MLVSLSLAFTSFYFHTSKWLGKGERERRTLGSFDNHSNEKGSLQLRREKRSKQIARIDKKKKIVCIDLPGMEQKEIKSEKEITVIISRNKSLTDFL